MSPRLLLVTAIVLCTFFVGAQCHPASAITSVMTSEDVGPNGADEGYNGLVPRNVESQPDFEHSSDTVKWTTGNSLSSQANTLTSQITTYNTIISQTTSDSNTLTSYPTSPPTISPTPLAAVTTITCTAASAIPLEPSIVPFIQVGVVMLGVVQLQGLVL